MCNVPEIGTFVHQRKEMVSLRLTFKIMENLDLKFRPVAEFVLDFIHQSPIYDLIPEGCKGDFKKYSYDSDFVLRKLLYTLYRVDFVSLDIYVHYKNSYTKLCLVFNDDSVFPSMRIECNIADCCRASIKSSYVSRIN